MTLTLAAHLSDRSIGGADALKIEEMEKMLREAQLEKARLIESRVRRIVSVRTSARTLPSAHSPSAPSFLSSFDEGAAAAAAIDPPMDDLCVVGGAFLWAQTFNHSVAPQERESLARRQMLEEERRRREEAEKRLQDETFHRQQLVEKEVKMRAKNFAQVSDTTSGA